MHEPHGADCSHILVAVSFDPQSPVHAVVSQLADTFRSIIHLPASAPEAAIAAACTRLDHNQLLDRTSVVGLLLNANAPPQPAQPAPTPSSQPADPLPSHLASLSLQPSAPSPTTSPTAASHTDPHLDRAFAACRAVRAAVPHAFAIVWHAAAVEDARLRVDAFAAGANMVSCYSHHVQEALDRLGRVRAAACCAPAGGAPSHATTSNGNSSSNDGNRSTSSGGGCTDASPVSGGRSESHPHGSSPEPAPHATAPAGCQQLARAPPAASSPSSSSSTGARPSSTSAKPTSPNPTPSPSASSPCPSASPASSCDWCGQAGLSPADLWLHTPLHHINHPNRAGPCPACGDHTPNLAVHIHEAHYPGGPRHEQRRALGAAVVVHRRRDNRFLMVQEFAGQGFWVPGGCTDEGEGLRATALRECAEEAGVAVTLEGLVEVATTMDDATGQPTWRLVTFYAVAGGEGGEGSAAEVAPKTVPCFESAGACWVSAEDLASLPLRSPRIPCAWFPHFAAGGRAQPLRLPADVAHLFGDVDF